MTLEEPRIFKDKPDLKPGEKRDVPFRFTVERPEDLVVEGL